MAETVYTTKDGDMIDAVVYRHYGFVEGALERVMEANPHLWDRPVKLPALVEIVLPEQRSPDKERLTRLWDT